MYLKHIPALLHYDHWLCKLKAWVEQLDGSLVASALTPYLIQFTVVCLGLAAHSSFTTLQATSLWEWTCHLNIRTNDCAKCRLNCECFSFYAYCLSCFWCWQSSKLNHIHFELYPYNCKFPKLLQTWISSVWGSFRHIKYFYKLVYLSDREVVNNCNCSFCSTRFDLSQPQQYSDAPTLKFRDTKSETSSKNI